MRHFWQQAGGQVQVKSCSFPEFLPINWRECVCLFFWFPGSRRLQGRLFLPFVLCMTRCSRRSWTLPDITVLGHRHKLGKDRKLSDDYPVVQSISLNLVVFRTSLNRSISEASYSSTNHGYHPVHPFTHFLLLKASKSLRSLRFPLHPPLVR